MRKIFLILALIIAGAASAQAKYYIYIPARTYHFERSVTTMRWFHPTEGGNIGAILVRQGENKIHSVYSAGYIRNSYGVMSVVVMAGAGVNFGNLNITTSAGLASGYRGAYEHSNAVRDQNSILSRNGILPQSIVSFSLNKGIKINNRVDVSPMVILSPIFVNAGIKINLKK